ncbi:hypothetical protein EIP91_009607 [Steccherinum ochraceum]|uniref:NAD(P)-binding protein n=1 Tax=Steccherinum ochraceum TaxID=92696 RepID=A0A4R0R9J0_9APHY|nr:hypothetical protein EIP91_009607 [Steccherinum ochraceum]
MAENILDHLSANSMFDMSGVVAVVTGGGTGIGLMIASTLVSNGATVYIIGPVQTDLDKVASVYNVAAEKTGRKGRMHGIAGDSEAKRLADEVGKRTPYITVLFNNAGILTGKFKKPTTTSAQDFVKAYYDEVPEHTFADTINVNSVGPYWLTFTFLPLLEKWKENSFGNGARRFAPQIIMTSSMNGWTKDPATAGSSFPYLFSKSAIGHATSTLAHELLPLGIRVNGIAPGLFVTEMSRAGTINELGISHGVDKKDHDFAIPADQLPSSLGGPTNVGGSSRDMGSLALFLVSNFFVNGETVLIDGGTLLVHPSSY